MCNDGNIDEASLDIVLERRPLLEGGFAPLERLWHFDPRYMALQYPLLFPWGDFGWTQDLRLAVHGPPISLLSRALGEAVIRKDSECALRAVSCGT